MPPIRFKTILLLLGLLASGPAMALPTVTVMSDKSMTQAIIAMARNYSQSHNVVINTAFTSRDVQQQQILDGGAADIVITPMEPWIEELKTLGLVDVYSKTEIAKNRLVLVAAEDNPLKVSLANGFPTADIVRIMEWEPAFVLGHPQTQAQGVYAMQVLQNLNVASDMEPYTLYIKQDAQMVQMLRRPDRFGIMLHTMAKNKSGLRIVDFFSETLHEPIRYYAVVIAGDNMNEARKFLNYLTSKEARRTLISQGFTVH